MTRYQARAKANALWETRDRVAFTSIRRKNVIDRFEVGYAIRGDRRFTVLGRGPSWEEAFARAAQNAGNVSC